MYPMIPPEPVPPQNQQQPPPMQPPADGSSGLSVNVGDAVGEGAYAVLDGTVQGAMQLGSKALDMAGDAAGAVAGAAGDVAGAAGEALFSVGGELLGGLLSGCSCLALLIVLMTSFSGAVAIVCCLW